MQLCELCEIDEAVTHADYGNINYMACERCKALAELEDYEEEY